MLHDGFLLALLFDTENGDWSFFEMSMNFCRATQCQVEEECLDGDPREKLKSARWFKLKPLSALVA
jgi:hypothetical protein